MSRSRDRATALTSRSAGTRRQVARTALRPGREATRGCGRDVPSSAGVCAASSVLPTSCCCAARTQSRPGHPAAARRCSASCSCLVPVVVRPQVIMRLRAGDEATVGQQLDSILRCKAVPIICRRLRHANVMLAIDVVVELMTKPLVSAELGPPLRIATPAVRQILIRAVLPAICPVKGGRLCDLLADDCLPTGDTYTSP